MLEAVVVVAPITVAVAMLSPTYFGEDGAGRAWLSERGNYAGYAFEAGLFALLGVSAASILSGWRLLGAYFWNGTTALTAVRSLWWYLALAGVIPILAALVSMLLPPSVEYSLEEYYRKQLEGFIFGAPLLLPLFHLFWIRRSAGR